MKLLDRIRCRKLKGAVLFTVVSVCAVIIIFVMATLTVVATVQKRTYSDYAKSQSYYTARSAVNSVIAALNADDDLSQAFKNISTRTPLTINMTNSEDMGQITSVYADKISEDMYKICATARVLDDETTVAVYVHEDAHEKPSSGKSSSSAITTFGSSGSENLGFYGGGAINIYAETCPSGQEMGNANANDYVGDFVVNASYTMGTSTSFVIDKVEDQSAGISVFGDFQNGSRDDDLIKKYTSNTVPIVSTFNIMENGASSYYFSYGGINRTMNLTVASDPDNIKPSDYPYIFCTGVFDWFRGADNIPIGIYDESAKVFCPVNIYCGSIDLEVDKVVKIAGSVYCYDSSATNALHAFGKSPFSLAKWIEGLADSVSTDPKAMEILGNFYSKGNVTISRNNNAYAKTYAVNGNMGVDGTLTINSGSDPIVLLVDGNLKAGDIVVNGTGDVTIITSDGTYTVNGGDGANKIDDIPQTSKEYPNLDILYAEFNIDKDSETAWAELHEIFAEAPPKTTASSGETYQDILDSFTTFPDDYELVNMLQGYYCEADSSGQPINENIIYHDKFSSVVNYANGQSAAEPTNYVAQEPSGGFIRTVETIKELFPVDEKASAEKGETIYACEEYPSPEAFEGVHLQSPHVLLQADGNRKVTISIVDGQGTELTNVNIEDYYTITDKNGNDITGSPNADNNTKYEGCTFTIRENAKITGDLGNSPITIDPQAAGKDLYVMLEGCTFGTEGRIVVNDVPEGNSGIKLCKMYISSGVEVADGDKVKNELGLYPTETLTKSNNLFLGTKYYYDFIKGSDTGLALEKFPTDERQMPNLYVYVQPYVSLHLYSGETVITGYINAPRSSINVQKGTSLGGKTLTYTSGTYTQNIKDNSLCMVGAFVFDGANHQNSNTSYIYISDDGRGDNSDEDKGEMVYTWQPLYYDAN